MMKYHSYDDPGHGWIQVEKSELRRLGIADKISRCSYQRGKFAYLEEDCDFTLFYKRKEEVGEKIDMSNDFIEHVTNNQSKIRGYEPYMAG